MINFDFQLKVTLNGKKIIRKKSFYLIVHTSYAVGGNQRMVYLSELDKK